MNLFTITQAVFPALRVLCLADCSDAGMHMLYYFSRMAKKAISSRKDNLNKITQMGSFSEVESSDSDLPQMTAQKMKIAIQTIRKINQSM